MPFGISIDWVRGLGMTSRAAAAVVGDRLDPPSLPIVNVRRERLLRALNVAVRSRVTVVVAPTGSGKSVLLAQWVAARHGRRVQWLTADATDNDADQFARDLGAALEVHAGGPRGVCTSNSHRAGDPRVFLILDDAHKITDTRAFDALALELEENSSLHLILSARSDPMFPVHRFRLWDQVAELRQRHLTFTHGEARELLSRLTGRTMTDEQVRRLVDRTEGWAVGLQLAGISLRSVDDIDEFLELSADDDRQVADYLTDRLLELQDREIQEFLLATSALTKMSAPLCNYVVETSRSQEILDDLMRASIVVSAPDERGTWFRYHRLFRTLLRQHARLADAELEREVLLRAVDWHLLHDNIADAIGYLIEAGEGDRAAEVVIKQAPRMFGEGQAHVVAHWTELLPERIRAAEPMIMLLELLARVSVRGLRESDRILRRLEAMPTLSIGDQMAVDTLRGAWLIQVGRPADGIAAAERALETRAEYAAESNGSIFDFGGMPQILTATSHLVRATGLLELGRLGAARDALVPLIDTSSPVEVQAQGVAALIDALSGRLHGATWSADRAFALADELGVADEPPVALALVALAVVAREQDDVDRASELLAAAAQRSDGALYVDRQIRVEQAELALRSGRFDEGLRLVGSRRG